MNGRELHRWLRLARLAAAGLPPLLRAMHSLDMRDRASLAAAFANIAYVESYLTATGDGALRDLAERCRRRRPRRRRTPPKDLTPVFDQAAWSVETASTCFPSSRCLAEAFALFLLLRRHDLPLSVVVGVARGERRWMAAHAWVELGTDIVQQPPMIQAAFQPIMRISAAVPATASGRPAR